ARGWGGGGGAGGGVGAGAGGARGARRPCIRGRGAAREPGGGGRGPAGPARGPAPPSSARRSAPGAPSIGGDCECGSRRSCGSSLWGPPGRLLLLDAADALHRRGEPPGVLGPPRFELVGILVGDRRLDLLHRVTELGV